MNLIIEPIIIEVQPIYNKFLLLVRLEYNSLRLVEELRCSSNKSIFSVLLFI